MARIPQGLDLTKTDTHWASDTGATTTVPGEVHQGALGFAGGLDDSYSVDKFIELGLYNWLMSGLTALLQDIARHGILEWHVDQAYEDPAYVLGSDIDI